MTERTRPTDQVRIGMVEDHVRYREALQATLASIDGIDVAWIAASSEDAIANMMDDPIDLAIVDLSLPGETGAVLIRRLRRTWPAVRCVVVSGHTEPQLVRQAFDSGAVAYVVKGRPSDLRDGITAAREGRRYVSSQLAP